MKALSIALITVVFLVLPSATPVCGASGEMLAAYHADVHYPEFMPLWREGWSWKDEQGEKVRYAYEGMPLGGYVFACFRNEGKQPLKVEDVFVEGVSLARAVAFEKPVERPGRDAVVASLQFSALPEEELDVMRAVGEPVWWKVEPATISPGEMGGLTIRLRRQPQIDAIRLAVPVGDGETTEVRVDVAKPQPRFFSISFTRRLDRVYAYLRHPSGKGIAPRRVLLDGRDVTDRSTIVADERIDTAVVIIPMEKPLAEGSYHVFAAEYDDGSTAHAGLRAWSMGLVYGMWGCSQGGETPEEATRAYVADLAEHNINAFMSHCGGKVGEYLHTPEGAKLMEEFGLRYMSTWPAPDRDPIFYFLIDEPDAADFRSTMLDPYKRIGSRAQYLVERCRLFRRHDTKHRPILLNIDNTFKPENWYTYAQLADIPCADPYYQEAVQSVWASDPVNLGAYLKPTYVYAVGTIYQSAGAPRPMHLILHSCRFDFEPGEFPYRGPTPEEKRVEVYYALAAGAKQLSYWWYTPGPRYYGCGGDSPGMAALWKEIGLLGAEVCTIGPLITRGCPAAVPVEAPRLLWVRSLLAGTDTMVLLAVNENMASDRLGTVVKPLEKAWLRARVPSWFQPADAFEITHEGVREVTWTTEGSDIAVDLESVKLTRMIVVTGDSTLRRRLAERYRKRFKANVARLSSAPGD